MEKSALVTREWLEDTYSDFLALPARVSREAALALSMWTQEEVRKATRSELAPVLSHVEGAVEAILKEVSSFAHMAPQMPVVLDLPERLEQFLRASQ